MSKELKASSKNKLSGKAQEEIKPVENTEEVKPIETPVKALIEEKKEEKPIPQEFLREFDELDLPPVYSNGKPYKVIDNEYVPLAEAEIIMLERRIKFYTAKLEYLKSNLNTGK
jgi:hypothetical protein